MDRNDTYIRKTSYYMKSTAEKMKGQKTGIIMFHFLYCTECLLILQSF